MKKLLILVVLVLAIATLLTVGKARAEAPEPTPQQVFDTKMDLWIEKLGACESNNNAHNVTPIDSDGTPSFGRFQYKVGTFMSYNKKYNVFPGEPTDKLMARMMNYEDSAKMTRAIVIGEPNGWRNWYNCSTKKIGQPPVLK